MRLGAVLLAIAVLAPGVLADHPEGERVERVTYALAAPGPVAQVDLPNPTDDPALDGLTLGGTALTVRPGEDHVDVFIEDLTTTQVPGRISFRDQNLDDTRDFIDFCFSISVPIPEGTDHIVVSPSPLVQPCPIDGVNYGPATSGELVVSFYD